MNVGPNIGVVSHWRGCQLNVAKIERKEELEVLNLQSSKNWIDTCESYKKKWWILHIPYI